MKTYREAFAMFEPWKLLNRSKKGEHLLKYPLDQKPTVTVKSVNERKENPPLLQTLRGDTLASARKNSGHPRNSPAAA